MYMCAMAIDFTSVPTISSHSIFKIFAMMRRFLFYILLVIENKRSSRTNPTMHSLCMRHSFAFRSKEDMRIWFVTYKLANPFRGFVLEIDKPYFVHKKKLVSSRPLKSVNTWKRSPFWNTLSREFRCLWRHLSYKLRPEIDNRFTFTWDLNR
jgi:hypothetical protein